MRYSEKLISGSTLGVLIFGGIALLFVEASATLPASIFGAIIGAYTAKYLDLYSEEADEFVERAESLQDVIEGLEAFEELDSVAVRILMLAGEKPGVADSYSRLVGEYWLKECKEKKLPTDLEILAEHDLLRKLKSPSSITRSKRTITNSDYIQFPEEEVDISDVILTSPQVQEFRDERAEQLSEDFSEDRETTLEKIVKVFGRN